MGICFLITMNCIARLHMLRISHEWENLWRHREKYKHEYMVVCTFKILMLRSVQGVSHSFYFGVKSNSNSFEKKGVQSTPPLLLNLERSEYSTPLPTPLENTNSNFLPKNQIKIAFFKKVHRFLVNLAI